MLPGSKCSPGEIERKLVGPTVVDLRANTEMASTIPSTKYSNLTNKMVNGAFP